MPTMKRFTVKLVPIKDQGNGGYSFDFMDMMKADKIEVEAETVPALLAKVNEMGEAHDGPCSAAVSCLEKRKPAGFDRGTRNLTYGLGAAAAA